MRIERVNNKNIESKLTGLNKKDLKRQTGVMKIFHLLNSSLVRVGEVPTMWLRAHKYPISSVVFWSNEVASSSTRHFT